MRTLVDLCFGRLSLAKRWAGYVLEVRKLRNSLRITRGQAEFERARNIQVAAEVTVLRQALKHLQQERRQLPQDVVMLLETAQSLIALTARGSPQPSLEYHTWLGEYRAHLYNTRQGRL